MDREIIFETWEEPEGGYGARAIGHAIFTQGDDWNELREMVQDATKAYFFDLPEGQHPNTIRLVMRKEVLAVA